MQKLTLAVVALALAVGLTGGLLLAGGQAIAYAQERPPDKPADKPVDIAAIVQPSPVVAAVPYQSRTEYEQDPFEPTRLRRTSTTVTRVMLVRQDGTVIVKDAP
jgi:hypothetical protein